MQRSSYQIIALVILAGLPMLAFQPVPERYEQARISDGDGPPEALTVEPRSPFPLLVLWSPADWRDSRELLLPVDSLTLEPLPGYEPLQLETGQVGGYSEQTVSPDGATAAFVTHAPGALQGRGQTSVVLVDLLTWEATVLDQWESPFGSTNRARPQFSADGRTLYWFEREPLVSGVWYLTAYDLNGSETTSIAVLPADFSIHQYRTVAGGARIAVLGVRVKDGLTLPDGGSVSGSYTLGSAEILLVDVADGTIAETIELDGIVAGSVALTDLDDDSFPVHNVFPGVAWSEDMQRLYVARADEASLTVVDLERASVAGPYDLAGTSSLLDRLTAWLMPSAQAVARQFSLGHVAILGDGEHLVVAMNQERLGPDRTALEGATHGLVRLVDTEHGDVLWAVDLGGVRGIATTPDGQHVLVQSYPRILPLGPVHATSAHQLTLLDGSTGDIINQIELPGRPQDILDSLTLANDLVYVKVSAESGSEMIVVDPESLAVVGGWHWEEGNPSIRRLIPLP